MNQEKPNLEDSVPGYAHWELRIRELMDQLGMPENVPLAQAFKQLVNEMMQSYTRASQSLPTPPASISTAHGPWIPSSHPGEEGESYCQRCMLRDKFITSRACRPHIVFGTH